MKYRTGSTGRVIVAKFEDRDDVLKGFEDIARKEDIRSGVIYLLGGIRNGRLVAGPEEDKIPPRPVWNELGESHEMVGMGTIFWQDDEPKIHLHGSFGKKDSVKVGCLREMTSTFLVLEAVIVEITGIEATREMDPASGMSLLSL
jgi:predicted DNA-binding protein with PD1-like motif